MPEFHLGKTAHTRGGHPASLFGVVAAVLVTFIALLNLAGCDSDNPTEPAAESTLSQTITVVPESEYTAGNTNTLSWTVSNLGTGGVPDDWSFLVQHSPDPTFTDDVDESPWVNGNSHAVTGLIDGVNYSYRVMARDGGGAESGWSAPVNSTQDAIAPVATVQELEVDQTSLLFDLDLVVEDAGSGVAQVELWFSKNGGDFQLHGLVTPGLVSFQTDEGGPHEFIAQATDNAGNIQERSAAAQAATEVPEPIILVDGGGYAWDITNAVLRHGIHLPWWDFGLGRFTIKPAIEPVMIGPNDAGWPRPDSTVDVVAVNIGGDQRAYKIGDLAGREVVDDVVNGVPVAGTY